MSIKILPLKSPGNHWIWVGWDLEPICALGRGEKFAAARYGYDLQG
jgi:hypothetical protein